MSDDTMPERITQRDDHHRPVEYVRSDVVAAQLAERDAKLKAIETIVHRWIDSKDRNLDNGGSMIKIIEVLYPPHTKTTEQAS